MLPENCPQLFVIALDSPEVTFHRLGYQIDAGIRATQVILVGELFPESGMLELAFHAREQFAEKLASGV